ncbi:serine-threonine/tyrosine-protein kinase catalytic domain-containing protein [Artemisia annua]|uniref:Serine-threonine/tyrosine-protein kinase catalytic domain-containing protein n=1 Tax=Artemisia annua TaxID=35608 RepID=A0A2U1LT62_ARTAN|nr:serine-threonine/tyrosine-protein kinase catalytic domain-containing protein [Artemisia annua]
MSELGGSQHLQIPLKDIELATKNYKTCIGNGGYGLVYKGELSSSGKQVTVAVKRLHEQFGQGLKEFLTEIQLLSGQNHPNLISLVGYCDEGKEKIIVYEFAERGSLDRYLKRELGGSQHLQIPLKDIELATKNYKTCIGNGGYGLVYKGELSSSGKQVTVAVKRLHEQFGQGLKEFLTEIQLLSGQNHPNLISLVGYCDEGKEKIIVYEFAERGSLDRYLKRGSNTKNSLTWVERLRICIDAARGLDHLHSHVGKHQAIIHRDIKSANILIGQNWVGKISDFGLSKLTLSGLNRSSVISLACGTPGYCDPQYISTGILTKKSDVYSFGMVLFEVLCGRLCNVTYDDGFSLSGPLAKDYYENKVLDTIVDPSLREEMSSQSMNKFSSIAYRCLHNDRGQRPSMDLVLKELQGSLEIQVFWVSTGRKNPELISSTKFHSSSSESKRQLRDGCLNREELTALLRAKTPKKMYSKEETRDLIDRIFHLYNEFIDGNKGLTCDGMLRSYDDGNGDLDSEYSALAVHYRPSADNSEVTGLSTREKSMRIFQQFDSNKDGGLNREEFSALISATNPYIETPYEGMSDILDNVFFKYDKFVDGEKGVTCDGLLKIRMILNLYTFAFFMTYDWPFHKSNALIVQLMKYTI